MEEEARERSPQAQPSPDQDHFGVLRDVMPKEVLEYAYEHDLITDHRLKSFSLIHLLGELLQSTIPTTTEDGFTDCSHLIGLELPNPTPRGERPSVTDSALKLICEARRILSDEEVEGLTQNFCNTGNIGIRGLKIELPDLGMGYDRDLREFRQELLSRRDFNKRDHRIPFDPVNTAAGEGLELPAEAQLQTEAFLKKLEEEKLGVTKQSIIYLVDNLKDDFTDKERKSLIFEEIRDIEYEHHSSLEKLELPISPRLRQEQSIPPSDAYLIPIPPNPSSSILSDDLEAAEARLFQDVDKWDEPPSPILDRLLQDSSPCIDMEPAREHFSSHKIEMPLLPGLSPAEPALSGPDALNNFIAEKTDCTEELEHTIFKDFSDHDLEDHLEAMADETMKSVEQEQLQAADAIARVPVPIMDFSILEPEWTRLLNSAPAIFKWIKSSHEDIFHISKWPRDMLTESKLIWRPVTAGTNANSVSMTEKIEASDILMRSFIGIQNVNDIPSSSDFVQRRERLVVLEAGDEEDDIEPLFTKANPRSNLIEMARKRGLDIIRPPSKRQHLAAYKSLANQTSEAQHTQNIQTGIDKGIGTRKGKTSLLRDSPTRSTSFLDHFVELHAPKKLTASEYFPSKDTKDGKKVKEDKESIVLLPPVSFKRDIPSKPVTRAPYPSIVPLPEPPTVFISISLARHLIRSLEGLVPNLTLIERDYRAYNTSVWSPGSVCRAEMVPPLAYDADITVSPTTGILVTSMIMIRQKPRPGLVKSILQERIERVSLRYERLIILIGGEGGVDDTLRGLSASETMALTEVQGFASGLGCKVVVHYVGGGDKTLSRWVASMVCRYAQVDHPGIQKDLLEAETLWELWLRRAGFNVYAAQAVAGQLKVPSSEDGNVDMNSSRHGLAAFVTMTRAERKQKFGQLVGLGVLERASHVVDEIWNKG